MQENYRSGCSGKLAYNQKEALVQVRLRYQRRHNGIGRRRQGHAYRCPHCHAWHVTQQPKTQWQLRKKRLRALPELPDDTM